MKEFHLIKKEGYNIIYDVEAHRIFSTDSLTFSIFEKIKKGRKEEEIFNLFRGQLDDKKIKDILKEIAIVLKGKEKVRYQNFDTFEYFRKYGQNSSRITLMVSQDCNLRCKYCYYGDKSKTFKNKPKRMSWEVARASIDFLLKRNPESKAFYLTFFGGEPLLNFPVIQKVILYCNSLKDHKFFYNMTTNGTLLDEKKIKFLRANNVNIMISLDGPQYIHDQNRIYPDGKGSFKIVMNNLEILKKYYKRFSIRATITKNHFSEFENLVEFFKKIGASQIFISKEDIFDEKNHSFVCDTDNWRELVNITLNFTKKVEDEIIEGKKPYYIPFFHIIKKIHLGDKSLISCGIMKASTAVSTDGKLYPCHRFVGMEKFEFGTVLKGINFERQKIICEKLDRATIKCNSCWGRYLCGRSCIRDYALAGGDFVFYPSEYCNLLLEALEDMIVFYTKIKDKRPEILEKYEKSIENRKLLDTEKI